MDRFLQTLMDALAVGSLYALIALGYTMVYGILKFINFAHSDIFVLGAWVSYTAAMCAGWTKTGQPAHIATWVIYIGYILLSLAALLLLYEKLLLPRRAEFPQVLKRFLPRSALSSTVAMMGVWAFVVIGLIHLARYLHASPSTRVVAGGVILIIAMLTCGLVGFTLERLAYKPLRRAPRLNVLITAIGVSLLLQNAGQTPWMFGTRPEGMPKLLRDAVLNESAVARGTIQPGSTPETVRLDQNIVVEDGRSYRIEVVDAKGVHADLPVVADNGGYAAGQDIKVRPAQALTVSGGESYTIVRDPRVPIRLVDVIGAFTAVLLMVVLDWLVFRTRLGRAMRAVSYNPVTASLMGIPVDRVISFTFVLGSMLAAAAGFLYPQKYAGIGQTAAPAWVLLGLKAFVAAVIGGIGNIRGAMLGGLLIGLLEFFSRTYVSSSMVDVYVFGLLILVLLFKPTGLLGKPMREKV